MMKMEKDIKENIRMEKEMGKVYCSMRMETDILENFRMG